jgi:hypothetical protein
MRKKIFDLAFIIYDGCFYGGILRIIYDSEQASVQ